MNPESEQFEQLRKLLALKRHEEPPPGYFNRFSDQVIARIKAGETAEENVSWLQKLWAALETKPMLSGAFGAAVCALAISGFVFSEDSDTAGNPFHEGTLGLSPALAGGNANSMALNADSQVTQYSSSTNPVSPSLRALLDQPQLNTMPASAGFGFPGSN